MSPQKSTSHSTRAFTLIELLTVIAIIGILAAIIIPTVSKVRATARNSQCVSRLRDWGVTVSLYSNDNKGRYQISNWASGASNPYQPYFRGKDAEMVKYYGGCPILKQSVSDQNMTYSFVRPSISGNIAALLPNPASGNQFVTLSKARSLSKFLVMCDTMQGASPRVDATLLDEYVSPLFGNAIINGGTRGDETVAKRHGGTKINGVFGDGSVKSITGSPLGSGDANSIYVMRTTWFQLY